MTTTDPTRDGTLMKVGGRPPLRPYLEEVWSRREFVYLLARFRIEAENQRNRLGMAWIVLRPLLNAAIYGLIFGILLGSNTRPAHFLEFLIIGVFVFEFFASSFTQGARAVTSNQALVQSLSFPRMSLPLSAVTQRLLLFLPMVAVMLVIIVAFGTLPQPEWLLLIPLTAILFVFNCGLAMITARLTVHFRDLTQLLPFITRLIFYTTGIFFSFDRRFSKHPTVLRIVDFQPVHEFLTLARAVLLKGPDYNVPMSYWVYSTVWAIVMFAVGVVFFWRAEERYGRTH